jgi:hypothetical protein
MARRAFFAKGKWNGGKGNRSINGIITDYKAFKGIVDAECERIMQRAADITLEHVKPYVPVETGALLESGRATVVKTAKGVAALVSFGGPDAPVKPTKNAPTGFVDYAVVINYDTNRNGATGEPFFLETGTAEARDEVDQYIMTELRKIQP